jgi:hypothetical protein
VSPISELGPDALLEPMTVDEFAESLAKKKITIKPLLLDQVQRSNFIFSHFYASFSSFLSLPLLSQYLELGYI